MRRLQGRGNIERMKRLLSRHSMKRPWSSRNRTTPRFGRAGGSKTSRRSSVDGSENPTVSSRTLSSPVNSNDQGKGKVRGYLTLSGGGDSTRLHHRVSSTGRTRIKSRQKPYRAVVHSKRTGSSSAASS